MITRKAIKKPIDSSWNLKSISVSSNLTSVAPFSLQRSSKFKKALFRENGFLLITFYMRKPQKWYWYHRFYLIKPVQMIYNMTLKGQFKIWQGHKVRSRSRSRSSRSCCISFDPSWGDKHIGTIFTFLSSPSHELFIKKRPWPLMTPSWPQNALHMSLVKNCTGISSNRPWQHVSR